MPYNLLIFPLIGGYYFLVTSLRFRYQHQRLDRQRLIFNSALAGTIFLSLSFLIVTAAHTIIPEELREFRSHVPFKQNYLGTSLVSLIIAVISGHLSNIWFDRVDYLRTLTDGKGDGLESLFFDALDNEDSVSITLKNRKVYVGFVHSVEEPGEPYVKIIPLFSGYREQESLELIFTTNYLDLYIEEHEGDLDQRPESFFELTIKKEEIIIANRFDIRAYERLNPQNNEEEGDEN